MRSGDQICIARFTDTSVLTADSSFGKLVELWLEDLDLEGRIAPSTRQLYEWNMRHLVLPKAIGLVALKPRAGWERESRAPVGPRRGVRLYRTCWMFQGSLRSAPGGRPTAWLHIVPR